MNHGVCSELEDEADALLWESLIGVTKHSEKADILTPWKYRDRVSREIRTEAGAPEFHLRHGMFGRFTNVGRPDLNSRDGEASFARHKTLSHRWHDPGLTPYRGRFTITLEEWKRWEDGTSSPLPISRARLHVTSPKEIQTSP